MDPLHLHRSAQEISFPQVYSRPECAVSARVRVFPGLEISAGKVQRVRPGLLCLQGKLLQAEPCTSPWTSVQQAVPYDQPQDYSFEVAIIYSHK